ncbi:MAG TPA: hypothetical protein VL069_12810, partial [Opitutus sp.]|nr:hypothetical protein [Opitutus sp.]
MDHHLVTDRGEMVSEDHQPPENGCVVLSGDYARSEIGAFNNQQIGAGLAIANERRQSMTPPAVPSVWKLTKLTLLAEGIGGSVWRAVDSDGRTSVVKRLSPQAAPDAPQALAWLRWRGGAGAIRLLD